MQINSSNDVTFEVYSRCLRKDERVTLGSNGQSANCMNYTVFAAPHLGDVNKDSKFNVADLVAMQKYLLGAGRVEDWQFGDMNNDERLNTFDMVLMRNLAVDSALSAQTEIPVVTMTDLTTQLYNNLYNAGGASETAKMHCYADTARTKIDNTHLSNAGASKIAQMIVEQARKQGLIL